MSKLKESEQESMGVLHKYKIIFIISAVIILAGLGFFLFQKIKKPEIDSTTQTTKVSKSDLRIAFSIDGKLVIDSYEPGFAVSGKVTQVFVTEGDLVTQGQWLASVDAQEAQKNLETALKDYSKERNDFDEDGKVTYANRIVTDTFKRILEKNQWDLDKAVLDVELKDLALKQSRVVSPVNGLVAQVNIKVGDVVSTQNQTSIVTIVKPEVLSFVAYAEEDDALKIEQEQTVKISLDAYEGDFPATFTFLSPLATIDSNGLSSYKVVASIENPQNRRLMDGMEGSVSFVTKEVTDVLTIPNKAVFREGTAAFVNLKKQDGSIAKTEIETGFTDGKNVEIIKGLSVGQEVVFKK